eukprot:1211490-Prymnesium_polylepis.1
MMRGSASGGSSPFRSRIIFVSAVVAAVSSVNFATSSLHQQPGRWSGATCGATRGRGSARQGAGWPRPPRAFAVAEVCGGLFWGGGLVKGAWERVRQLAVPRGTRQSHPSRGGRRRPGTRRRRP